MRRVSGTREISVRRVLVVDDHEDSADLLAFWLEQEGYETSTATDGASGLSAAIAFEPDVALLDLCLPPTDGYELARAIRARPELERCRLIAVSGYSGPAEHAQSRLAGFERLLTKPVNLRELALAIRFPTPDERAPQGKSQS